jgi:outer membrane murein-binding lipoprotein Lpp
MREKRSNLRIQHVGKTYQEKVAYQKFLREYRYLDKTEENPTGLEPTYQSSFDDERKEIPDVNVTPKSWRLKFWDFCRNNIGIGIITAIIILAVTGYLVLASTVNSQNVKIDQIKEDVKTLKEKNDSNNEQHNNLNTDFQVFKAKVEKDIEFIKTYLSPSKK